MKNRIVKVVLVAVAAAVIAGCVHIDVDKTEKTTARASQPESAADEQTGN